jgi:hypothetical protein
MQSQRGAAAIEFAIVAIPLITLCFAGLECSLALQRFQALQFSVAAAVRYLSLSQPGDSSAMLTAQCLAITGTPNVSLNQCTDAPIVPGAKLFNAEVCDVAQCSHPQQMILADGTHLNLVSVSTRDIEMTDFPEWLDVLVFPNIQYSMVQPSA